jgi:large subunit ribosomal protein L6
MSRIGKKLIEIPQGVNVQIFDKEIIVKGPKGELKQFIHPEIKISALG